MKKKARILIIDDDEGIVFSFETALLQQGYDVSTAGSYVDAMKQLGKSKFELILADLLLGGKTGLDVLRKAQKITPLCPVVLMTGYPDVESAAEAVRLNAFQYLPKPVKMEILTSVVKNAIRRNLALVEEASRRTNLEAMFSSMTDAIVTVNTELEIKTINKAAENLFNVGSKKAAGKQFESICNEKSVINVLAETVGTMQSTSAERIECSKSRLSGHVVSVTAHPMLDAGGACDGALLVIKKVAQPCAKKQNDEKRSFYFDLIGKSEEMQRVYEVLNSLATYENSIMLTGESGTGKELAAMALHLNKNGNERPFVAVNCGALSEHLLESELFGHVKGAFTGAVENKIGRFQLADGGTIFLDEIGDISENVQLKLLRVAQEMVFERVGDAKPIKINAQIITATNKNLSKLIKLGKFREDLYHRLNVMIVNLPPLRKRSSDIPVLTRHFLEIFNKQYNKNIEGASNDVMKLFSTRKWPGNVRELRNTIERAVITCNKPVITLENLPPDVDDVFETPSDNNSRAKKPITEAEIAHALKCAGDNKSEAARLLIISRKTLYEKMRKLNML